ncbi:MAG: PilZ domain-containing protein [Clostridiales Family XIII bacterium]|jgi:hypothetical protein|nr:PilZ domain-containing protein [Clostridiales Family XIII bacterium]
MAVERRLVKVSITGVDGDISISSEKVKTEDGRVILLGRGLEEVPHQTPVDVIAYYEDGIQFMWGIVTLSIPSQLNVDIVSVPGKRQERRENLKVRTSFDAVVEYVCSMGRRRRKLRLNAAVRIRDLSLGGAGFFSNHTFFKKQRLTINMDFLKPGLKVEFQVLRRERQKDALNEDSADMKTTNFRYRYGGRILKLSVEQERLICEHVFKVQLTEHKRRKEVENNGD